MIPASPPASNDVHFLEYPGRMVRMKGLEPSLRLKNSDLNAARLPIPPHPHRSGSGAGLLAGEGREEKRESAQNGTQGRPARPARVTPSGPSNRPRRSAWLRGAWGFDDHTCRGLGPSPAWPAPKPLPCCRPTATTTAATSARTATTLRISIPAGAVYVSASTSSPHAKTK